MTRTLRAISGALALACTPLAACDPPRPIAPEPVAPPKHDAGAAPARGAQKIAELGTCKLESGKTIERCRVGYRTFGALNPKQDNLVLFPTWFTGATASLTGFVPDELVDTRRFFLVLVDALADGVSSSPSNSDAQGRRAFPEITIGDMVESQRRLLREVLKVERPHAVVGISMGGMQALEWAVRFPGEVARVGSVVGTPQLTSMDLLLWTAELHALESDVAYRGGAYQGRPQLRAVQDIHNMMLTTPADRAKKPRAEFPKWLAEIEADTAFDWNDWRAQLLAMMAHDVARRDGGSLEAAGKRVKAKTLLVVDAEDHMVNPEPSRQFARAAGARLVELRSGCGHMAPGCAADDVKRAVHALLDDAP